MTRQEVKHHYVPRAAFAAFHARSARFALIVAHRRAGKTVAVINDMVVRALSTQKPRAFYAYVAPYMGQAKQIAWAYIKDAVRQLPGVKVFESLSQVVLPNGATVRVFGADNEDALRGLYFDGVVLDEFGDMRGRVWNEVIRPALADRQGWAVFIGTPRGKNKFYEMAQQAQLNASGAWYFMQLRADESGLIPEEELASIRADEDEDVYAQEFLCSFDASIRGSYYGKQMAQVEQRGQVKLVEPDLSEKVSLAMDIGYADATAIWFWQVVDGEVRFIDYWEETGYDAEQVVEVLQLRPYDYETWWLPHDAAHKTFQSKKSVLDTFRAADAPARMVPNPDGGRTVRNGIDAVRKTLRNYPLVFDSVRCKRGVEALKNYSRAWDRDAKVFSNTPKHDEWSHGADAFRYACLVINQETLQRSVERSLARKARAGASGAAQPEAVSKWTFDDAWRAHDRKLAAARSAGRQRI